MTPFLLPLILLLLLRFWGLDLRPIHHDEAVNGWFVDGLFSRGFYIYDPENYHGPLYFYLVAFFETVFGRNVSALRIPAVLSGIGLSLSPLMFTRWIGTRAAWISVGVLTLSPAMVFFSRYSIHESSFALACVVFLRVWLSVRETPSLTRGWIFLGILLGLMASLKENFAVFGAALVLSELLVSLRDRKPSVPFTRDFWKGIAIASGLGMVLILVLFTGFFRDWSGAGKFFIAFWKWTETGRSGHGHEKPFFYWVDLMARLEWPALLGLLASGFLVFTSSGFVRLNACLGGFLWLIYSGVSYKTPWCILSFIVFLVISFGVGADRLFSRVTQKAKGRFSPGAISLLVGAVLGAGYLGYRAVEVAYVNPDQDLHPYIYGQTYRDMMGPVDRILHAVQARKDGKEKTRIQIVSSFTWPLPYLLGEVKQTGYYGEKNAPAELDADYLIIDEALLPNLESRIKGRYQRETARARQWASPLVFLTKVGK